MKFTAIPLFIFLVLLPSFSAIAQEDFYHPELDWKTIETEHFYVNYHEGAERTARAIAKIAEEIYGPITTLYHHTPDSKVSFVIKDYDDYSNGAAYFYDNKIEIWASSLDFDLRGTHNWLRNVVTHEFTHIVQIQTSMKFGRKVPGIYVQWLGYESERRSDVLYGYPNVVVSYPISGFVVPSWFAEGVAQFNRKELGYDAWDSHRDMILRMYALDGNMLTWDEMSVFGKTSLGNESSYNAGFAFVRYVSERFGTGIVEDISRNLSTLTEVTIDGAIERATGIEGRELYNQWRASLEKDYADRTANVRNNQTAGKLIADVGFGNFYPTFSPDGQKLAYISNKKSDYFAGSAIYLYDLTTREETKLKAGVRSTLSWSPDGNRLYFSKTSRDNPHWSNLYDLYVYDLGTEEEKRLTEGRRAMMPSVSPDGSTLAYVSGSDGTTNIFTCAVDGSGQRQVTYYMTGDQVYNPRWSPDGRTILYDYSIKDGRDIASIPSTGGEPTFIIATPYDERNPVFTPDGKSIIYSSDKTGIFNLYKLDRETGDTEQLTNVLGGAFQPAVNKNGALAFASYTSTGYKIAAIDSPGSLSSPPAYVDSDFSVESSASGSDSLADAFDWRGLRSYDDGRLPDYKSRTYKNIATSLSIVPFVRIDNYNKKNRGLDIVKPGAYVYSYDMLDRYGFFAGAAMNTKGERDLFFIFDFRGRIPGLFQLGAEPALSLEAYNVTRKTDADISLPLDTINVGLSYNLIEFDIAFKQKLLTEALDMELRFAHSRYTASIDAFRLPARGDVIQAFSELYFIGNDLSATFNFKSIALSRTMEINPAGRKIKFRYDHEFSNFNPTNDYEIANGLLVPKYQRPRFHRIELSWKEYQRLPGWRHTLAIQLRGGSILGPPVDEFFDFYVGGLAGMKGYPFYSMGGNEFAYANVAYRFPVVEHIDFRFAHLYFDKLYASVYGDVGNTWSEGSPTGLKFKRDIGAELRLEAFSYYAYPTRIFFSATYGLDEFNRFTRYTSEKFTYGKEWNFHLGVLFGFDFD